MCVKLDRLNVESGKNVIVDILKSEYVFRSGFCFFPGFLQIFHIHFLFILMHAFSCHR